MGDVRQGFSVNSYIGVQITKAGRERFHFGDEGICLEAGDMLIWSGSQPTEFTVMERLQKNRLCRFCLLSLQLFV